MIGISGSLIWSKTMMELIINPCDEFRCSPADPVISIQLSKEPWSAHALISVGRVFYAIKNINQSLKCVRKLNELMRLNEICGYA